MGTIISHGKSQWGRANKHKRNDVELEDELNSMEKTFTKKVSPHSDIIAQITETVEVGKTFVTVVGTPDPLVQKANAKKILADHKINSPSVESKIEPTVNVEQPKIVIVEPTFTARKETRSKGVSYIEDIDGWEEKLKLLNGESLDDEPMNNEQLELLAKAMTKPKRKYSKRNDSSNTK